MADIMIYLAVLLILVALFWFLLLITDAWKLRRLRKHYDESKDLSKQGEQARRSGRTKGRFNGGLNTERESIETGVRGSEITDSTSAGQDKLREQRVLSSTAPKPIRENSHSFRVSNRYKY